jgi:hypothetical protein
MKRSSLVSFTLILTFVCVASAESDFFKTDPAFMVFNKELQNAIAGAAQRMRIYGQTRRTRMLKDMSADEFVPYHPMVRPHLFLIFSKTSVVTCSAHELG